MNLTKIQRRQIARRIKLLKEQLALGNPFADLAEVQELEFLLNN